MKTVWYFNEAENRWELYGTEVARKLGLRPMHTIYGHFNMDGSHFFKLDWEFEFETLAEAKAAANRWLVGNVIG